MIKWVRHNDWHDSMDPPPEYGLDLEFDVVEVEFEDGAIQKELAGDLDWSGVDYEYCTAKPAILYYRRVNEEGK